MVTILRKDFMKVGQEGVQFPLLPIHIGAAMSYLAQRAAKDRK